jgi:hypothetical protein
MGRKAVVGQGENIWPGQQWRRYNRWSGRQAAEGQVTIIGMVGGGDTSGGHGVRQLKVR